ncbi:MAG: GNAT superfamily N-acetyltransferase [Planctomycetaceae bacterium]
MIFVLLKRHRKAFGHICILQTGALKNWTSRPVLNCRVAQMTDDEFDQITRRPIQESDDRFLFDVFLAGIDQQRKHVTCTDEQWVTLQADQYRLQTAFYHEHWSDSSSFDIIELNGRPIGRIYEWQGLDEGVEQIRVIDFSLLAEFRNQGIGSRVIKGLIDRADGKLLPVRTRIAPVDLSRPFLERHGFTLLTDEGMTLLFQRLPGGQLT